MDEGHEFSESKSIDLAVRIGLRKELLVEGLALEVGQVLDAGFEGAGFRVLHRAVVEAFAKIEVGHEKT